jgi:tyrosine-protein kinase Etk/Wzc
MSQPPNPAPPGADDEIDLGPLWAALRAHARFILGITLAAAALAVLTALLARPVFQANGSLYLGDVSKKSGLGGGSGQGIGVSMLFGGLLGGGGIETQVEILKSRDLVVSVIEASGFNARVWRGTDKEPPSVRYWRWRLLDGKRLSAWAPGPQALEARNAAVTDPALAGEPLTIRFAAGGVYRVLHGGRGVLDGRLGEPAVGAGLRLLLQPAHAGFVPVPGAGYRLRVVRAVRLYHGLLKSGGFGVSTTTGGRHASQPTLVVALSYKGRDPYRVQRFLADLMRSYLAQNLRWSTERAGTAYHYLNGQLHKMRDALEHADRRLADYKKTSGVIAVSAAAKAMIGQLAEYQTQRSAAELRLYNLRQIARLLAGRHPNIDPYLLSAVDDRVLDKLSGSLAAAQTELAALAPRETGHAPQVIQVRARVARIQASIRALIDNQRRLAGHQVAALDRLIARFEKRLRKLPEAELKVVALTRSSKVLGKLYMFLLQKQQEAAISKMGTVSNNRILDQAETTARPVSPRARTRLTLGLVFGLFLGVSWVLGRALFTPGFRSEEELRRAYPALDWYALLPHFHRRRKRAAAFAPADSRSDFGEAIRTLRGNLYLSQHAGRDHLWMVTSAAPGDGKSTVTYELAAALAHDGKRVLLIDADIRKPQAHEYFGVAQAPGLSDVLAGRAVAREAVRPVERLGFDLLPGGPVPPNPAELIGSPALRRALSELGEDYEFVLLDTPPYPRVGDAPLVARHVERILSVVRIARTPRGALAAHLRGLAADERSIGLVVNDLGSQGSYGYGYGYGYGSDLSGSPWRRRLERLKRVLKRRG